MSSLDKASKFDLHIHSKYSFDSFMDIEKIIKVAKKRGIDGIAIADHNTIKGGREVLKIGKNQDFITICGSETATDMGDIVGLFVTEEINTRNALEVVDEIKSQGGLSILPHPYKRAEKIADELLRKVDGVEGLNARTITSKNEMAKEIAAKYNLPMTAGSDAHFYFEVGRGLCISKKGISTQEELRKFILKGSDELIGIETPRSIELLSQGIKIAKMTMRRLPIKSFQK